MHSTLSRTGLRLGHLIEGALLVGYVYTPLGDSDLGRLFARFIVVPAIITTGLLMWKLPALRARSRARQRAAATVNA